MLHSNFFSPPTESRFHCYMNTVSKPSAYIAIIKCSKSSFLFPQYSFVKNAKKLASNVYSIHTRQPSHLSVQNIICLHHYSRKNMGFHKTFKLLQSFRDTYLNNTLIIKRNRMSMPRVINTRQLVEGVSDMRRMLSIPGEFATGVYHIMTKLMVRSRFCIGYILYDRYSYRLIASRLSYSIKYQSFHICIGCRQKLLISVIISFIRKRKLNNYSMWDVSNYHVIVKVKNAAIVNKFKIRYIIDIFIKIIVLVKINISLPSLISSIYFGHRLHYNNEISSSSSSSSSISSLSSSSSSSSARASSRAFFRAASSAINFSRLMITSPFLKKLYTLFCKSILSKTDYWQFSTVIIKENKKKS
ncbi:hypothetical protein AGLY_002502 [Aphis glycines]|uniref:Uncharacterized protein n=1 Tax=Aphis glycines TaxID=307491 RepID=A0A6G0U0F0_APHGL|nr:hypothetical protein AGLY_002502 [Aphis glycines]